MLVVFVWVQTRRAFKVNGRTKGVQLLGKRGLSHRQGQ